MSRREWEDMERVASCEMPFEQFKCQTFLITGATGLIGSLLVKNLLHCSQKHDLHIKVFAVVRNIRKAREIFADYLTEDQLEFVVCDLSKEKIILDDRVDYIVHAAAITQSKVMVTKPVETIRLSLNSTDMLLSLAFEKRVKSFLYISSMEVYGTTPEGRKTDETVLGYLDLKSVRSCYPESKRMCECLCNSYAEEYGLNVKIARLAQTFGAGVLKNENRVFAQFARSVIEGKDIILHTEGKSEGNYVYTRDAIKALFLLLMSGADSDTFNISNEATHTTIADMAHMVVHQLAHDRIKVKFDIPEDAGMYGYAADTKLFLDAGKMRKLGWYPEVGLKEAFERMIDDMRENL